MTQFEVRFSVDGRAAGSIVVEVKDSMQAKRIALGEIQGRPGYEGKRITISSVSKIR